MARLDSKTDFQYLIDQWPDYTAFADDLGVAYQTGYRMYGRNSVNAEYWGKFVKGAIRHDVVTRGGNPVTVELLQQIQSRRRSRVKSSKPSQASRPKRRSRMGPARVSVA